MNWLDRTIAAVSPERGLARARARVMTDRVVRAYEAGKPMPRGREWAASAKGPNAELGSALRYLRRRSREVVRDGSYGARAVGIRVNHEIGYGITPRPGTGDPDLDKRVLDLWNRWGTKADLHGRLDIYGLQALMARTRAEAGEGLMRMVRLSAAEARRDGIPVPLLLEALEPDLLDDAAPIFTGSAVYGATAGAVPLFGAYDPEPARVVDGIEFDIRGRRAAYRLLRQHPGEGMSSFYAAAGPRYDTVPAFDMIHLVRAHAQRPGQVRGVPDAAPVLMRLRRLEEFEETSLEQAKVQALLGVFYTTPNTLEMDMGEPTATPIEATDRAFPTDLWPGMAGNLPIGSDVKFLQPSGPGPFEPFALHELMAIASGFRVTYAQLTGDLRQANYSSLRAGMIDFRRDVETDQWLMHIPMMCQPIWDAFIRAAILFGAIPDRDYPVTWSPPRFEMVDPEKDIGALNAAVRAGFETWDQAVASMGYDPDTQAKEIAAANGRFDSLGLILSSDPRRITNGGAAQDPRVNSAVEIAAVGAGPPRE